MSQVLLLLQRIQQAVDHVLEIEKHKSKLDYANKSSRLQDLEGKKRERSPREPISVFTRRNSLSTDDARPTPERRKAADKAWSEKHQGGTQNLRNAISSLLMRLRNHSRQVYKKYQPTASDEKKQRKDAETNWYGKYDDERVRSDSVEPPEPTKAPRPQKRIISKDTSSDGDDKANRKSAGKKLGCQI